MNPSFLDLFVSTTADVSMRFATEPGVLFSNNEFRFRAPKARNFGKTERENSANF